MIKIMIFFFSLITLLSNAQEEHLVPIENILTREVSNYKIMLKKHLFNDITACTYAKFVVIPSDSLEKPYSLTIHKTSEEKFYLKTLHIVDNIEKESPKIQTSEIEVNENFAISINGLFLKIISQTQFAKNKIIRIGGATFYFIASDYGECYTITGQGYGIISGVISAPETNRFQDLILFCDSLFDLKSLKDYQENEENILLNCNKLVDLF